MKFADAHHHQRRKRDPGIRQLLGLEWLRLVPQLGAVALALRLCGAAAALDIGEADDENEHGADQAEPWRGPGRRLEERRRNDVLDLRRARQSIHGEVNAPSAIVQGISRFGIPLWRNISAANG